MQERVVTPEALGKTPRFPAHACTNLRSMTPKQHTCPKTSR